MTGVELLKNLITATGLPPNDVERELERLLAESGIAADKLTIEDLRTLLAEYLQEVLVAAQKEFSL